MLQALTEFRIGRPQMIAGLMLLAFLAQCLWAGRARKISDLEYQYMLAGLAASPVEKPGPEAVSAVSMDSPFTALVAALPLQCIHFARKHGPASWNTFLAVPRPWLLRLPFAIFGVWLGGALWWVARRLFDNAGGYVALGLYCTSPALIKISSNIGPEILLAWSILGLIYTAIGVAHTLYAPPRKWAPRIVILGLSLGFALATAWWAVTLLALASAYMFYLAPGCRKKVLIVLAGASAFGCMVLLAIAWIMGSALRARRSVRAETGLGCPAQPLISPFGHNGRLPPGLSVHCLPNRLWKLAESALFWEYGPAGYRFGVRLSRLGSGPAHMGRSSGADLYVHIYRRGFRRPAGDRPQPLREPKRRADRQPAQPLRARWPCPAPMAAGRNFGCSFPAPVRSYFVRAAGLGTKLM